MGRVWWLRTTQASALALTCEPRGGRPAVVATLQMWPARTSALVVTCTAWQSIHLPGASFDDGQAIGPGI